MTTGGHANDVTFNDTAPAGQCNLSGSITTGTGNNDESTGELSCSVTFVTSATAASDKYKVQGAFPADASVATANISIGAGSNAQTGSITRDAAPTPCTYELSDLVLDVSSASVTNAGGNVTATAKAKIQSKGSNCAQSVSSVLPVTFSELTTGQYVDDGSFSATSCNLNVSGVTTAAANNGKTDYVSCSVTYTVPAPNGAQDNNKYGLEATFAASTSGTPTIGVPANNTADGDVTRDDPDPGSLVVTVTANPPIYTPGDVVTFSYEVSNTGSVATPLSSVNPPWTLDDQNNSFQFTPADPCDISNIAPGTSRTCTATYQTSASPQPELAVDTTAGIQGKFSNKWNITYNDTTAMSRQIAEGWTFDLTAEPLIYEEGGQITFTGVVRNISISPHIKLEKSRVLLVLNGGASIEPDSCTAIGSGNSGNLAPGEFVTCTWLHGVTQDDLDAGKIVAVATVKGDYKKYKDLTLSDSETLLSEGSAANMVQNTVGSFIKRRMDQMLANEPAGYKIRNRNGGAAPGMPVAVTGMTVEGGSEVAFATSSRAMAAAGAARPAKAGRSGNGSTVTPTADAIIVPEKDYNWWVEGKYTGYQNDSGDFDRSGYFGIIHAGIDRKFGENTIAGVMLSLDWAQESASGLASVYTGDSEVSGFGWMVGPYVSTALTPNVFLDLRAAYGQSNNDVDVTIMDMPFSGGFDTTRWLAQASISGQYQWGKFTFVPEATLSYMNEKQHSFDVSDGDINIEVGSQSFSLTRLRVGPEISLRQEWEKGSFTPYVKPSLIWDISSEGKVIVGGDANLDGEVDDASELRAAIEGGLRVESDNGVTSSMSVTYDGIGVNDLSALTFTGDVSFPF